MTTNLQNCGGRGDAGNARGMRVERAARMLRASTTSQKMGHETMDASRQTSKYPNLTPHIFMV